MFILTEKGLLTKNDIEKLVLKLDEESCIFAINLPLHGFLQPKMQASKDLYVRCNLDALSLHIN